MIVVVDHLGPARHAEIDLMVMVLICQRLKIVIAQQNFDTQIIEFGINKWRMLY
jgi:hypothetical protein